MVTKSIKNDKSSKAEASVKIIKSDDAMDRATLKAITNKLKSAGAGLKILKGDTDLQLQKKVNEELQRLPSADVVKQLESIDPNKLVNVLKADCLGIFVDFGDVSCVRCADAVRCVDKFVQNLKGGMAHITKIATSSGDEVPVKVISARVTPATHYDQKRQVFVRDVVNPNPKDDDYHDMIQRVLDDQPETLGELRAIVEAEFDLDGDGDFMKFVTALRDPKDGVIKLDIDLTEADKATLKKAGYDLT